jgi:predicted phage terminase large subunit-like protein
MTRLPTLIELDQEIARRSLSEFCKMAWHVLEPATPIKWGWALDAMCEHLEAVHNGQIKRLLMNVPPGMMKSLLTGVFFPAWEWGAGGNPSLRYLTTAHKEDLAIRDNLKCRRLISSDWYQERWSVELCGDQNAKKKFENTATGFRESMAFRSLTGSRGDRIIIDDPLSVDDAFSEAALSAAEQTFLEAVPSRVNNQDSAIIVIMQRLHERDTAGIILSRQLGYEHLMLPMRFEPERRCATCIGFTDPRTEDGELLFPERFSEAQVSEMERTMGSFATAGQLQQRPMPRGGGLFKSDWIQHWDKLPERFDAAVISWDMTFKESATSDFVVGQVWGRKDGAFYLIDQFRGRWDFVKSLEQFVAAARKYPRITRKLIEDKANGPAIISALKRKVTGIIPITPKESKEARANAVTTLWEARNVYLPPPDRYPWVAQDFIPELLAFPSGAHDDQCFAAGTLIATPWGDRPIESLKAGDHVITPMGIKRVLVAGMTGEAETITKYGITATKDHPFLTRKGRFKAFCQVTENECLGLTLRQMTEASILIPSSSTASRIGFYRKDVITSASQPRTRGGKARKACTSPSGRNTLGKKSLPAGKFTIRMATRLITNSATLSAYRAANTLRRSISILKGFVETLTGSGLSRPLGTEVRLDALGTGSTRSNPRPSKNATASVAGSSSSQKESTLNIALGNAKSNTVTTTMRSRKTELAWSAEQTSQLSSARTGKEALSRVAENVEPSGESGSRQPVFNLTIEDAHCFYANGLLVHNCDAMSQALTDLNKHSGLHIDPTNLAYLLGR